MTSINHSWWKRYCRWIQLRLRSFEKWNCVMFMYYNPHFSFMSFPLLFHTTQHFFFFIILCRLTNLVQEVPIHFNCITTHTGILNFFIFSRAIYCFVYFSPQKHFFMKLDKSWKTQITTYILYHFWVNWAVHPEYIFCLYINFSLLFLE